MIQIVELHHRRPTEYDPQRVKDRVQAILQEEVDTSPPGAGESAFLIFHRNHPVQYAQGQVPAQTALLTANEPVDLEKYRPEIQQSWSCRQAEEILSGCQQARLVTEMMARLLPPADRVRLFHGVLQAVIELTTPDALVFKHSQQVIAPADYLAACGEDPFRRPGSLNVRFFNIAGSGGERVMDTRGLTEIGLHDLQCHYRLLDPTRVAQVLFNTALYIFQNGPVIQSGETVAGIDPGSKWRCQFENALLEPKRDVLDLNPGEPHAAGDRR